MTKKSEAKFSLVFEELDDSQASKIVGGTPLSVGKVNAVGSIVSAGSVNKSLVNLAPPGVSNLAPPGVSNLLNNLPGSRISIDIDEE